MKEMLSIIVPLYNQEKYIHQCVTSILAQRNIDIQLIIVNDGSTDSSLDICNNIAENDDRVLVVNRLNGGPAEARKTGLEFVQTKYVTFVDADDFILPNAYESAIKFMNDDVDMIFYEISRYFDENRIRTEQHIIKEGLYNKERIEREVYPKLIWDFYRKTPGIECSQCVKIVKKSLLERTYANLGENRFYYGEDIVISYPMFTYIDSMAVISESYYMHRQRENDAVPNYIESDRFFSEVYKMCEFLRKQMSECEYDFHSQIDYFYMYSVELKKKCYGDYFYRRDFMFPFDKVEPNKQIILYGAGDMGRTYYNQLTKINYCSEIIWVDRSAESMNKQNINGISILYEDKTKESENVVIAIDNETVVNDVKNMLLQLGYDESKIVY